MNNITLNAQFAKHARKTVTTTGIPVGERAREGESHLFARAEYPNGLAFSPDESVLYVANSRASKYLHAFDVDKEGVMIRRRIFADMNSDETDGGPDGVKVDSLGRVFCTGPGGVWVFEPSGEHIGIIRLPEIPYNMSFGGDDLCTMFFTARTSIYTLRLKTPGNPHPWYAIRARLQDKTEVQA